MAASAAFSLLVLCTPWQPLAAQVVVVNASFSEEAISLTVLRAIFTVRLQSLSGQPLTLFVLDDHHPAHIAFSKEVLGVFPYQLESAWNRAVFSGTGRGPVVVRSEAEMARRVAETPGGVGYLSRPVERQGVRLLPIVGDAP